MPYKTKSYKVDFFVVTHDDKKEHAVFDRLLAKDRGYTAALSLMDGEDEKYQIRSIVSLGGGRAYKGVFGRCRFGETPLQGTEDGREADVKLKPGHGLVEKNHFIFYTAQNLLVFQRNPSGSHYSRFVRYSNLATKSNITFEPILTTDSYRRLLEGGAPREIDVSFQKPSDPELYANVWTQDVVRLVKRVGGINARVRISVGRSNRTLATQLKDAAVNLARGGLAKVARVKLEGEQEPIDLITDRVSETITVKLGDNGRPDSEEVYAALEQARSDRRGDIKSFYGS